MGVKGGKLQKGRMHELHLEFAKDMGEQPPRTARAFELAYRKVQKELRNGKKKQSMEEEVGRALDLLKKNLPELARMVRLIATVDADVKDRMEKYRRLLQSFNALGK